MEVAWIRVKRNKTNNSLHYLRVYWGEQRIKKMEKSRMSNVCRIRSNFSKVKMIILLWLNSR